MTENDLEMTEKYFVASESVQEITGSDPKKNMRNAMQKNQQ